MSCEEIQDSILNESDLERVKVHVRRCEDCQAFRDAAQELDQAMMRKVAAPARLKWAVMAAVTPRPSYWPLLLDFMGWASMAAVMIAVVQDLLAT